MTDKTVRPLALALIAQVLLGAALLVWAAQGFPLPSQVAGSDERTTPATATAPPAPTPPVAAAPPGADHSREAESAAATAPAQALAPRPTSDRFPSGPAFALLREQVVRYGWRPAGSRALRRLSSRLRALLPAGRYEAIPGHPGLRNVVGSIPGRGKAIVLGAHYDVEARPMGFVGANDGAAGTAAVVWLARALARAPRRPGDRPLRFVLFDGEEEPAGCEPFEECGLRGSKAYAERHADATRSFVLLDYIAEAHGLSFPREATSDVALWRKLRTAASDVGVGALFPARTGGGVLDDHTPFLDREIPAIDVIDFDYPQADTLQDTLDKVSERSLDAVGEAAYLLVSRLRRER